MRSLGADEKGAFDGLMRLAEFRNVRIANRRDHEWKVTLALWALLAAGIAKPPTFGDDHLLWLLLIIWISHAVFWVGSHWAESKMDIKRSFFYTDRAHNIVVDEGEMIPVEKWYEMSHCKKWLGFVAVPRCWAQIITTGLLAVGVYMSATY